MKRILVIFILVVGFFALQTFYRAGQFKSIKDSFEGIVTSTYTNIPGPEDAQIDRMTNTLFIAGSERRPGDMSDNGIYALQLDSASSPLKLGTDFLGEFNPHGISLLRKDSILYLFAVNHNNNGDFVELFRVGDDYLHHMKSLSHEDMCCPNDLIALDLDKVYISNDHGSKEGLGRTMEDYLNIPRASIFFYDGNELEKVAKPFHYANGLNISRDGTKLYLAETTGKAITTFSILPNGELQKLGSYDAGTGVDNIDIDEEGNLWVAAHPRMLDFVGHVKDSLNFSPSEVLKLVPVSDHEFEKEVIYLNTGEQLSASSVAISHNNELFIGVVFNRSLLRAKLP